MPTLLPRTCELCGCEVCYRDDNRAAIAQGVPLRSGNTNPQSMTKMHYGHHGKNARDEFLGLPDSAWIAMGIKRKGGHRYVCYECHEVILHNPVLSEDMLDKLAVLFHRKTFAEKVMLFNKIISIGLDMVLSKGAADSAQQQSANLGGVAHAI